VSLQCQAQALPSQQFSEVGGHRLALACRGSGDKTVVLIAGMGLDAPATYKNTHSFGGLVARAYVQAHPQAVKGIVFVDCVHESWYPAMKTSLSPDGWRLMESIMNWERDKNSHEGDQASAQACRCRCQP
jgi:hypothetical protein